MLAIQQLKNEKGSATIEMIPIMIIIVLLLSFSFGFFGVIHTGILNSMAARNYAFETFNHRADLRYFRSVVPTDGLKPTAAYHNQNYRIHAIVSENRPAGDDHPYATTREISFGWDLGQPDLASADKPLYHKNDIYNVKDGFRFTNDGVNPVWIQSSYGICLNTNCGGE